jgi:hypothetical protein
VGEAPLASSANSLSEVLNCEEPQSMHTKTLGNTKDTRFVEILEAAKMEVYFSNELRLAAGRTRRTTHGYTFARNFRHRKKVCLFKIEHSWQVRRESLALE